MSGTWSNTFLKQGNSFSIWSFLPLLFISLTFKYLSLKITNIYLFFFKAWDVFLWIEKMPVREGAAPSLWWGPRRSEQTKRTVTMAGWRGTEPGPAPCASPARPQSWPHSLLVLGCSRTHSHCGHPALAPTSISLYLFHFISLIFPGLIMSVFLHHGNSLFPVKPTFLQLSF